MENVDPLMGIILPYVNFAIFLVLGWYFFRGPARKAAQKRREAYEKALGEATRAKEDAEARMAEINRRYENLDAEMAEIKKIARDAAEADAEKIVADAQSLAHHIKEEAGRIAEAEVTKAREKLREEIVDSVQASVTKKIREELGPQDQLSIAKKKIESLKEIRAEG